MTTQEFAYWLQGYFELVGAELDEKEKEHIALSTKQVQTIRNHLNLVFAHDIDPEINRKSKLSPEILRNIHGPQWGSKGSDDKIMC